MQDINGDKIAPGIDQERRVSVAVRNLTAQHRYHNSTARVVPGKKQQQKTKTLKEAVGGGGGD